MTTSDQPEHLQPSKLMFNEGPQVSNGRDLVAEARALATPPRSARGDGSPLAERGRMIHRLADEIEALRTKLTKVQAIRDTTRREYHELHVSCEQRVTERNDALALLDRIREALAGHPRCDVHPDDDVISCGWKHTVASVQWALDTTEPTTEETPA